jgi:hypothetical protein
MDLFMTAGAQGDQIPLHVATYLGTGLNVMNLQVLRAAAMLAAPPVSLQDLAMEFRVKRGLESQPPASQGIRSHDVPFTLLRKSCHLRNVLSRIAELPINPIEDQLPWNLEDSHHAA